jgi:hypothetical protein
VLFASTPAIELAICEVLGPLYSTLPFDGDARCKAPQGREKLCASAKTHTAPSRLLEQCADSAVALSKAACRAATGEAVLPAPLQGEGL